MYICTYRRSMQGLQYERYVEDCRFEVAYALSDLRLVILCCLRCAGARYRAVLCRPVLFCDKEIQFVQVLSHSCEICVVLMYIRTYVSTNMCPVGRSR